MPRAPVTVLLLLAVALAGCPSHDDHPGTASRAAKAAKDFVAFAHGGDAPGPPGVQLAQPPKVVIAERRVLGAHGDRPRVDLVVSMPLQTRPDAVKTVLEAAARGPEGRGYAAVRVRAFPGRLTHLVGPYGTLILADDGRGWDGTGKSRRYRAVARRLGGTFSVTDLKALTAVDQALAGGAGLERAVAEAAQKTRLGPDAVSAAVARAKAAWPKP